MKKTTLIFCLMLIATISYCQQPAVQYPHIWEGDTTISGTKFIFNFLGSVRFEVTDSITSDSIPVATDYASLLNSRMVISITKRRIASNDTIQRIETYKIPLSEVSGLYNDLIRDQSFRKVVKKRLENESVTKKLSQE